MPLRSTSTGAAGAFASTTPPGCGVRRGSAARRLRPPHPARRRDASAEPADQLPAVAQPRRRGAGGLATLSRQQPARDLRTRRRADPADAAGEEESVCRKEEEVEMTAR